jgi:hypothetical protein
MNKKEFWRGLTLNAALTLIFLSVFYGNLFSVFNRVYFGPSGDGLMMYTNMIYHVKYSPAYQRVESLNYPYGEHVFFANNQPLISNSIKFFAKLGLDVSNYTIGITNALMVFSILGASILLFLIFWELGVGWLIGSLAAIGIAFLSPQLDRFGGHYNLSYVCSIPWFIYIFLRFFRKPSRGLTIIIFITAVVASLTHFYLYAFLAIIALFFYVGYGFLHKGFWKPGYIWAVHLFIQLVLPYIILQGMYYADSVTDRPAYPWGFLEYRAYPQSVFLPAFTQYGQFLRKIVPTGYVEWEGISFVGCLATIFSIILLWKFFSHLAKKRYGQLLTVTPDFRLNILFWASIAALLYSFGIPFVLGLRWLVDYIGPLRQMRGIGRFAWVFYFVINIVVFYWLYFNWKNQVKKLVPTILIVLAFVILYFDAYSWAKNRGKGLENYLPEMQDIGNKTIGNQWINRVNINDYQAILPIPYFHVGSENIWIERGCNILQKSLITSYQTGLPSMAVMLARTSIGQTCNNLSIMLEPSLNGIKSMHFPSDKPLLLIAAQCNELSENEKRLIHEAKLLDSSPGFDYYSLPLNSFEHIYQSSTSEALKEFSSGTLVNHVTYSTNESVNKVITVNYDSIPNDNALAGKGCYQGISKRSNQIFDSTLPNADTSTIYTGSIWFGLFRRDLTPRSNIIQIETDQNGKDISYKSFQIFRNLCMIDGNWALIEWNFKIHDPRNRIRIFIENRLLHSQPLIVDELLIRPSNSNVYQKLESGIRKNNRFYLAKE